MIGEISDPRIEGKIPHNLSTIIFGASCGILSGCESWNDMRNYCKIKRDWLSHYISLENGTTSGDTFRRAFTIVQI